MDLEEIIEDLAGIKRYFIDNFDGCYPLALDEAIKHLSLDKDLNDTMKLLDDASVSPL